MRLITFRLIYPKIEDKEGAKAKDKEIDMKGTRNICMNNKREEIA